jgi:hypothetical protein
MRKNNMTKHDDGLEKELQAKGKTAPRITPDHVDATIVDEAFYTFPGTTVTICLLTLKNGFSVTGESAAASPENYDREIGNRIARDNARDKIWALEAYLLKQGMYDEAHEEGEEE